MSARLVVIVDYFEDDKVQGFFLIPEEKEVADLYAEYRDWAEANAADSDETPFFDFLKVKGYEEVEAEVFEV